MTRKDKFHLISFFLLLLGAVLLDQSPKFLSAANPNAKPQFRLTEQDAETHNLDNMGVNLASSGFKSNRVLYAFHETFINVRAPSATLILDPMVVISTRNSNTGGSADPTSIDYSSALFNDRVKQPGNYSRTVQVLASGATGFLLVTGTDTWGRSLTDRIEFTSSPFLFFGKVPFSFISSVTFRISSFTVSQPTATFLVGTSTGVGIQNIVDLTTGVTNAYRNGFLMPSTGTRITADQNSYIINLASNAMDNAENVNVAITTKSFVWHDVTYNTHRTRHGQ